jgi:hypothetical protein
VYVISCFISVLVDVDHRIPGLYAGRSEYVSAVCAAVARPEADANVKASRIDRVTDRFMVFPVCEVPDDDAAVGKTP